MTSPAHFPKPVGSGRRVPHQENLFTHNQIAEVAKAKGLCNDPRIRTMLMEREGGRFLLAREGGGKVTFIEDEAWAPGKNTWDRHRAVLSEIFGEGNVRPVALPTKDYRKLSMPWLEY